MTDLPNHGALPTPSEAGQSAETSGPQTAPNVEGYRIVSRLGEGGMGTVWRAVQLSTRREVALKILAAGTFASHRARVRFEREVELAASLEHRNIARIYDSGLQQGACYYAMELVDGVPLDEFAKAHQLTQRQILGLLRRVCRGVQHAHQHGVIHRDLKPSNILVGRDAQPRVVDFGLAKLSEEGGVEVTQAGEVAGTPAYMAPEQAAGKVGAISTRTDVYALGVILYRLLTGYSPHDLSGTRYEVFRRIAEEEVIRPREARASIDADLEALLLKALAKDPELRYVSAGDLASDITNYLNGEPLTARPPTTWYFLGKRARKYRWMLSVAASIVLLLLGMAGYSYVRISRALADAQAAQARAEVDRSRAVQAAERERSAREALIANQAALIAAKDNAESQRHRAELEVQKALKAAEAERRSRAELEAKQRALVAAKEESQTERDRADLEASRARQASTTARRENYYSSIALAQSKIAEGAIENARAILASAPREYRHWEWGRLMHLCQLHLFELRGHSGEIWMADFSPDGQRIVTAGSDGAKLWDAEDGRELRTFKPEKPTFAVAFSPDGQRVVTGNYQIAAIWDCQTGRLLLQLEGHKGRSVVRSVSFSSDGRLVVTASDDGTAKIWRTDTGREMRTLKGHSGRVSSASFSPDGERIVTASVDGTARVWASRTGRVVLTLAGHSGLVNTVSFSSDGRRIVTASDDGTAKVWDAETGNPVRTLQGVGAFTRPTALRVGFSPDSRRIVTVGGDSANVWDVETGRRLLTLKSSVMLLSAAFGPLDRRIVTVDLGPTADVWDADAGRESLPLQYSLGLEATDPGGRRVLKVGDNGVEVLDTQTGRELLTLEGRRAFFSPDGHRIVTHCIGGGSRVAKVWDLETGRELLTVGARRGFFGLIAFSPDGARMLSCEDMATTKVRDVETGRELLNLDGPNGLFSLDGRMIATRPLRGFPTRSNRTHQVRVWDALDWTKTVDELEQGKLRRYRQRFRGAASRPASQPAKP